MSLPQEYIIDAQEGVREPHRHVRRVRLEAKVHLGTLCWINAAQNIEEVHPVAAVLETDEMTWRLEQLASSYAMF